MKQRINRASYFLRDGQYFPILFDKIADDSPVKNPLLSELHYYDNNDGQNTPGGHFDIYGFPPETESMLNQAAWDEEVDRNESLHGLTPPPPITPEQAETFQRDVVSHYTVGEIETIDYIFDKLGYEGGMAYVIGNLIKYPSRANHKGCRRADITKIRNYATIALEHMDKNGELE